MPGASAAQFSILEGIEERGDQTRGRQYDTAHPHQRLDRAPPGRDFAVEFGDRGPDLAVVGLHLGAKIVDRFENLGVGDGFDHGNVPAQRRDEKCKKEYPQLNFAGDNASAKHVRIVPADAEEKLVEM